MFFVPLEREKGDTQWDCFLMSPCPNILQKSLALEDMTLSLSSHGSERNPARIEELRVNEVTVSHPGPKGISRTLLSKCRGGRPNFLLC